MMKKRRIPRGRSAAWAACLVGAVLVTGCNNTPPPTTSDPEVANPNIASAAQQRVQAEAQMAQARAQAQAQQRAAASGQGH